MCAKINFTQFWMIWPWALIEILDLLSLKIFQFNHTLTHLYRADFSTAPLSKSSGRVSFNPSIPCSPWLEPSISESSESSELSLSDDELLEPLLLLFSFRRCCTLPYVFKGTKMLMNSAHFFNRLSVTYLSFLSCLNYISLFVVHIKMHHEWNTVIR